MTRSAFNRMIVSSAASIWGDLSHGVDCLRIGTATAAACKGGNRLSLSPTVSLYISLSLSPSLCPHVSGRIGKSRPCVCVYLT